MARRSSFPVAAVRTDPRLFGDYARLWAAARRSEPAAAEPVRHDAPVHAPAAAMELLAGELGPVVPGPAHALVAERDPGVGAWGGMDADPALGELAYVLVRARRPDAVVETGVAGGVTSAFLLAALADNGHGELHSIDLPPRRMVAAGLVGAAVPAGLRSRWHYHWGAARRLLPRVLGETAGGPRVFLHDSDHSYAHMRWELERAWAALVPGDWIVCDDLDFHTAFGDVARAVGAPPLLVAQPAKRGTLGLLRR